MKGYRVFVIAKLIDTQNQKKVNNVLRKDTRMKFLQIIVAVALTGLPALVVGSSKESSPTALLKEMIAAVKNSDIETIKNFLAEGNNIESFDASSGNTLLMLAVQSGSPELIKFLLDSGANINAARKKDGQTALYSALVRGIPGDLSKVNQLLAAKADVNVRNNEGLTPLMALMLWLKTNKANKDAIFKMVELLLQAGADPEERSKENKSARTYAREIGFEKEFQTLVNKYPKTEKETKRGSETRISETVEKDLKKQLKDEIEKIETTLKSPFAKNVIPLIYQYIKTAEEIIKKLEQSKIYTPKEEKRLAELKKSSSKLSESLYGAELTPEELKKAIEKGDIEEIEEAVQAIREAIKNKTEEKAIQLIKKFLDAGGKVDEKIDNKWTLLVYATIKAKFQIMEFLIKNGAAVNAVNPDDNRTPLILAITQFGKDRKLPKIIATILQAGANEKHKDNKGKTALDYAKGTGVAEAYELAKVIANKIWIPDDVMSDIDSGAYERKAVKEFIAKKESQYAIDPKTGETLLLIAVARENSRFIEQLLANGADINARDSKGETPLFMAFNNYLRIYGSSDATINTLLRNKADVNIQNNNGETVAIKVIKDHPGALYLFKALAFLLDAGADLTIKDKQGKTIEDYAKENKVEKDLDEAIATFMRKKYPAQKEYVQQLSDIKTAIKKNNIEELKKLIDDVTILSLADESGYTPLLMAIEEGNAQAVSAIINRTVEVNNRKLLIKMLEHRNNSKVNALELAKQKKLDTIYNVLEQIYATIQAEQSSSSSSRSQASSSSSTSTKK